MRGIANARRGSLITKRRERKVADARASTGTPGESAPCQTMHAPTDDKVLRLLGGWRWGFGKAFPRSEETQNSHTQKYGIE